MQRGYFAAQNLMVQMVYKRFAVCDKELIKWVGKFESLFFLRLMTSVTDKEMITLNINYELCDD